jgi:hypothetical protein
MERELLYFGGIECDDTNLHGISNFTVKTPEREELKMLSLALL